MGDKNKLNAKSKVPGLALKPATTATQATGGSATARAILENTRGSGGSAKGGEQISKAPNLASSGRGADLDFFGMLNEEPPQDFRYVPNAIVRGEILDEAQVTAMEAIMLGPQPHDAKTKDDSSTTVKGKAAQLEKNFNAAKHLNKQPPGSPYNSSTSPRPVAMPGKSTSSTAIRTGAATGATSSTSSTSSTTTSTTSTTSAKDGKSGNSLPPLPNPPNGGARAKSGSQPVQSIYHLDYSPQGPVPSKPTRIAAGNNEWRNSCIKKVAVLAANLNNKLVILFASLFGGTLFGGTFNSWDLHV